MVRSKKPAPPKPVEPEFTEPVEVTEVTEPPVEPEVEVNGKKKPGRKPSPLTTAIRDWEQAKRKTAIAQKRYDRVDKLAIGLEEAKTAEQAAYERLQQILAEQGATT